MAIEYHIPRNHRIVEDSNGNVRAYSEPSHSAFMEEVLGHISECKNFRGLYTRKDFKSLSELLICSCGCTWMISDLYLREPEARNVKGLLIAIEQGMFGKDGSKLMDIVRHRKGNTLKAKIIDRIEKLKAIQGKINRQKKEEEAEEARIRLKRFQHPISSLEIE